jgi:hypothetical protein
MPPGGGGGYQHPPAGAGGSGQPGEVASVQYRPPEGDITEQAALAVTPIMAAGVPSEVLSAKAEIEAAIKRNVNPQPGTMTVQSLADDKNVQGVAIGMGREGQGPPGTPVLTVFVAEPVSKEHVRSMMVHSMGVQAAGDIPIEVITSGVFDALPNRAKIRPAPGGFSVAHFRVTAGTLGCLATGRSAPRNERLLMLSNNHVLANVNNATYGDCICQPGPYDGGSCPNDQVAILERFVPIQLGGATNYVDCATGWCWPDRVRPEIGYVADGLNLFHIGKQVVAPALGMMVGKSGRTTQLTSGQISALNWSGKVSYGEAGEAYFENQIIISGTFSAGGDSGSCIWTWDAARNPVGLLFAGGGGYTIANPMSQVLAALDINLVT